MSGFDVCESKQCSDCGAEVPPDAPEGLCRRCLLGIGLEDPNDVPTVRIRCPHCHQAVEVLSDAPLRDISCASCDARFSLIDEEGVARRTFSRFDLIERVGAGSFGVVWRSRDRELDRTVAVKIPHQGQLSSIDAEQFFREARAAAQLKHPNIVRVHEVGREKGSVYIVSDYIPGRNLADWMAVEQVAPDEAASLIARIADAVHHAHQQGVIHRDLKPSNVVIDAAGEPHIMDFGLAKRDAGEVSVTLEGNVLGTPAYMSPEQARGESHRADRRSDVYSLGVVLFELLTGERPFRGETRMLLEQVVHESVPPPRKLNAAVPRDLETICLKCLEKEPGTRYATAADLADELRRTVRREPIQAHPITPMGRLWRWCRRKPAAAGLVAAVAGLLLLLAVGGPLVAMQQVRLAEQEAEARELTREEAGRLAFIQRNLVAHYGDVFELLEKMVADVPTRSAYREKLADIHNDLAWFLATCPDPKLRDPVHAVQLAEMAVRRGADVARFWRTLGVAHYRRGDWQECVHAIEKGILVGSDRTATDCFFFAMACWQLGQKEAARKWYATADALESSDGDTSDGDTSDGDTSDVRARFHMEAATLLGIRTRGN
ncbi:MAG: protein kinase [Pirellulales bacterium]